MSTNKSIAVKILGKDYQVGCPDEQTHHLIDAALLLDNRMREIRSSGRVIGVERIAVMAALNLAHELLKLKDDIENTASDTDKRLQQLHEKLSSALTA